MTAPEDHGADRLAKPLASVAMITYNHAPYIAQAITSILAQQTSFVFELVIGDDCSSDGTSAIVDSFAASRPDIIRVLRPSRNRGACANLLAVEAACSGEYIAYCEGDDYWHDPSKLAAQTAFLADHPDYSLSHTDFRTEFASGRRCWPRTAGFRPRLKPALAFDEILGGTRLVMTVTAVARMSALQHAISHCPELSSHRFLMGDTQRWLELARLGKVHYDPVPRATRRILSESASQSKDAARRLRFARSCADLATHYAEKYPCAAWARDAAAARSARNMLRASWDASDPAEAEIAWTRFGATRVKPRIRDWLYRIGASSQIARRATAGPIALCALPERLMGAVHRRWHSVRACTSTPHAKIDRADHDEHYGQTARCTATQNSTRDDTGVRR